VRISAGKPSPVSRLAAFATLSRKRERGFEDKSLPARSEWWISAFAGQRKKKPRGFGRGVDVPAYDAVSS
jgi:hypothetical protein